MDNRGSMKSRLLAASAAAVLMLSACGGKDDNDSGSKNVDKASSPIEQSFKLDNAKPLDVDAFFTMLNDGEEDDEFSYDSTSFDEKSGATIITNLKSSDDESTLSVGRVELYGVKETIALIEEKLSA